MKAGFRNRCPLQGLQMIEITDETRFLSSKKLTVIGKMGLRACLLCMSLLRKIDQLLFTDIAEGHV